jgi:hypothetical protein
VALQDVATVPLDVSADIDVVGSHMLGSKVSRREDSEGRLSLHHRAVVASDGAITVEPKVPRGAAAVNLSSDGFFVRKEADVGGRSERFSVVREEGGVPAKQNGEHVDSATVGGQASDERSLTDAGDVGGIASEPSLTHEVHARAIEPLVSGSAEGDESEPDADGGDYGGKHGQESQIRRKTKRKMNPSLASKDEPNLNQRQYSSSNLELNQNPPEETETVYEYYYVDDTKPATIDEAGQAVTSDSTKTVWAHFHNKSCRGQNETDDAAENYEMVQSIGTLDACKAACNEHREAGTPCRGVDFREANEECKMWSNPIGVQVDADGGTCATLVNISTKNVWEDFGNTSCRGQNESDNGKENYESLLNYASLEDCKDQCSSRLGVGTPCYGVEFDAQFEECKLWGNPITLQVETDEIQHVTCSTVSVVDVDFATLGKSGSSSGAVVWGGIILVFICFAFLGGFVTWGVDKIKPQLVMSVVEMFAGTSRSPESRP